MAKINFKGLNLRKVATESQTDDIPSFDSIIQRIDGTQEANDVNVEIPVIDPEAIEEIKENSVAIENYGKQIDVIFKKLTCLENMKTIIAGNGGIKPTLDLTTAKIIKSTLEGFLPKDTVIKVIPSVESFDNPLERRYGQQVALEGIAEVAKSLWEKLMNLIKSLFTKTAEGMQVVFSKSKDINNKAKQLKENVIKLKENAPQTEITAHQTVKRIMLGKDVISDSDLINIVKSQKNIFSSYTNCEKLIDIINNYIKQFIASVGETPIDGVKKSLNEQTEQLFNSLNFSESLISKVKNECSVSDEYALKLVGLGNLCVALKENNGISFVTDVKATAKELKDDMKTKALPKPVITNVCDIIIESTDILEKSNSQIGNMKKKFDEIDRILSTFKPLDVDTKKEAEIKIKVLNISSLAKAMTGIYSSLTKFGFSNINSALDYANASYMCYWKKNSSDKTKTENN